MPVDIGVGAHIAAELKQDPGGAAAPAFDPIERDTVRRSVFDLHLVTVENDFVVAGFDDFVVVGE
jgi:hypothetical protein